MTKTPFDSPNTAANEAGRQIRFTERSVVKYGSSEAIEFEACKTRAAWALSQTAAMFKVARVLGYESGSHSFEQERLFGYEQLQRRAAHGPGDDPIWERIGRILGTIHRELSLPDSPDVSLPVEWQCASGPQVRLHGDFNLTNVRYNADEDTILVIDWAVTDMIGGVGNIGPIYFDLGWFLKTLFFLSYKLVFRRRTEEKADRFLAGYVAESGYQLEDDHLARFAITCAKLVTGGQTGSRLKRALDRRFLRRLTRYMGNGFKYRNYLP